MEEEWNETNEGGMKRSREMEGEKKKRRVEERWKEVGIKRIKGEMAEGRNEEEWGSARRREVV